MSKKNKPGDRAFVYSTDPNFQFGESQPAGVTLAPHQQKLKIRIDKKQRAGKVVTLVEGFIGKEEDLEVMGKLLRNLCGSGGSAKDKLIIIQGDHREKIKQWLVKNGYDQAKVW